MATEKQVKAFVAEKFQVRSDDIEVDATASPGVWLVSFEYRIAGTPVFIAGLVRERADGLEWRSPKPELKR